VVITTLHGIWLQMCCTEKSRDNTSFVTDALAACSKVKGFPDCQLFQVDVLLVNIAGGPLRNELIKGVAIVCDATLHLQTSTCKERCDANFKTKQRHTDRSGLAQLQGPDSLLLTQEAEGFGTLHCRR